MSQKITKNDNFQPTPAMTIWLDTAIQNVIANTSEIAKKCNISRQTWYRWVKDDEFRRWFKEEWEKQLSQMSFRLDIIGLQKASEDFRYWKAMQERIAGLKSSEEVNIGIHESLIIHRPERSETQEEEMS